MDPLDHFLPPILIDHAGGDRRAAGRQFVDHRDFEVGVIGHRQGARNRRGRHHQLMRHGFLAIEGATGIQPFIAQCQTLTNSEAMLFVHDHQAQLGKLHGFLDQRMSTDHQLRFAGLNQDLCLGLFFFLQAASEPSYLDA